MKKFLGILSVFLFAVLLAGCTKVNEKPVIEGAKDVTITKGDIPNVKDGVKATDKEDGELTLNVDLSYVVINAEGTYPVIFTAKDKDGNEVFTIVKLIVKAPATN